MPMFLINKDYTPGSASETTFNGITPNRTPAEEIHDYDVTKTPKTFAEQEQQTISSSAVAPILQMLKQDKHEEKGKLIKKMMYKLDEEFGIGRAEDDDFDNVRQGAELIDATLNLANTETRYVKTPEDDKRKEVNTNTLKILKRLNEFKKELKGSKRWK